MSLAKAKKFLQFTVEQDKEAVARKIAFFHFTQGQDEEAVAHKKVLFAIHSRAG